MIQQGLEGVLPVGGELYSCPQPADFPVAGAEERKVQLSLLSGERLLTPGFPWVAEVGWLVVWAAFSVAVVSERH